MEKKYEFTGKTIKVSGKVLHRIKAVRDFGIVKAGTLGGFIEKEENLSHEGNCWVYDFSKVYDDAKVCEDAKVFGCANVFGNAKIFSNAQICGYAKVYGYAEVYEYAKVYGYAKVYEQADVYGDAEVCGCSEVYGYADVCGGTKVDGNAKINAASDYIVFKNWWSSGRFFTWTRSNNMWSVGCFYGTGNELIEKAYKDSEISGREYERVVKYVESILKEK